VPKIQCETASATNTPTAPAVAALSNPPAPVRIGARTRIARKAAAAASMPCIVTLHMVYAPPIKRWFRDRSAKCWPATIVPFSDSTQAAPVHFFSESQVAEPIMRNLIQAAIDDNDGECAAKTIRDALGIESDEVVNYSFPKHWPDSREQRARVIGDWLRTEARFLANDY
jgi:hypothetical protein